MGRGQDRPLRAAAPYRAGLAAPLPRRRETAAGAIYRLGLALLDAERPEHVLARSSEWLFGPEAPYERTGDVGQVVFPCGWLLREDGDTLNVYYGAADTSVCVATASLSALLDWLARHQS